MPDKYIDLLTDFGFKKIFGTETNKFLLIDFLNSLLEEEKGKIIDLTYLKNEHLGLSEIDRKAIFDLYCQNEAGEKFIVELQKAEQTYFKDRSIYYATFPVQEQAKKGKWNFELKAVYTIAIMDFCFDNEDLNLIHKVKLFDLESNKIFSDKLSFIYLELPKFNKQQGELKSHFDKWLFVLKNLAQLDHVPKEFQEKIFKEVFELGEITKYNPQDRQKYEDSLKAKRDWQNSLDTSFEKGIEQGMQKGIEKSKFEIAKNMLSLKIDINLIMQATGLSKEEIESLSYLNS